VGHFKALTRNLCEETEDNQEIPQNVAECAVDIRSRCIPYTKIRFCTFNVVSMMGYLQGNRKPASLNTTSKDIYI
jgi:hypothetical protein